MRTETAKYEFNHGRKPKGYGVWFFEITGTDGEGRYLTEVVFRSGRFSDARKAAVAEFKASSGRIKRVVTAVVLP